MENRLLKEIQSRQQDFLNAVEPLIKMKVRLIETSSYKLLIKDNGTIRQIYPPEVEKTFLEIDNQIEWLRKKIFEREPKFENFCL